MRSSFRNAAVLLAANTLFRLVGGQTFASLPACGQTCWNDVLAKAATFGCNSATPEPCLCGKQDFTFAVRDCAAQNCGDAALAVQVTSFASALCATATVAAAAPAATTPPTTTTPPAPPPTTSSSSTPPPPPPPASSSSSTPTPATSTSVAATPTTASSTSTTSSSSSSSATSATGTSSKSTTASTTSSTSTPSSTETATPAAGLSTAAKAGIGAAAAVGAAALLILVLCLLARKKRQAKSKRGWSMQISEPLPGSGRNYGDGMLGAAASPAKRPPRPAEPQSELEQRSRRYEDMIPRQTPRHMV